MTPETFLQQLDTVLDLPQGSVSPQARLDELGWDSMAELSFISIADDRLGVQLSAKALANCTTVADLMRLVNPTWAPPAP